jgi:hypothetical protein
MRTMVCRVEQQHNCDRYQCKRNDKDAWHYLCAVLGSVLAQMRALVYLSLGGTKGRTA